MSKSILNGEKNDKKADHDAFFKRILINKVTRVGFLRTHLGEELLQKIDIENLELQKESYIDPKYEKSSSDIVLATKQKDKYLYMLLEHQSSIDRYIAFRLMKYEMQILERFKSEYPEGTKFPIVFPVVIYNGKEKYNVSTKYSDLFCDPILRENVVISGYNLIDLQKLDEGCLEKRMFIEFFAKAIDTRNKGIEAAVEKMLERVYNMVERELSEYEKISFQEALRYSFVFLTRLERDNIKNIINKYDEDKMKSLAQEWMDEGMQKGIQAGMQQGMQQGIQAGIYQEQRQIAKNMLSKNLNLSLISDVTGLSIEEIEKIQQKNQ